MQIPHPPRRQPIRYLRPARPRARAASRPVAAVDAEPSGRMVTSASALDSSQVKWTRAEAVEVGGHHDPGRAAPRRSGRRTARSCPASGTTPGRERLHQPDQRRRRMAHHGAPGRGVDRPRGPEDTARTLRSTNSAGGAAVVPGLPARRRRCRRPSRAAGTGRSTASPSPRRGQHRVVPASTLATVAGGSSSVPIRKAISGSARGWISSPRVPAHRGQQHPGGQPAVQAARECRAPPV